jgi:hypothetical protein
VSSEVLLNDIKKQIMELDALRNTLSRETAKSLDERGRNLWNLCLRRNQGEHSAVPDQLLSQARVFAFLLVGLSRAREDRRADITYTYLLNLSLSTGRQCLAQHDLNGTRVALTKGAEYLEHVKVDSNTKCSANSAEVERLEAEYLIMRTALVRQSLSRQQAGHY